MNASLERYAKAAESYEAYVRLDDRSPRVLYKLALARFRLGQAQAALAPLTLAASNDDPSAGLEPAEIAAAHYLRGLCLRGLNQPSEAATALEAAIRLDPGLTAAREELADVYTALHRDKEAATQLEALAAFEPARVERQRRGGPGVRARRPARPRGAHASARSRRPARIERISSPRSAASGSKSPMRSTTASPSTRPSKPSSPSSDGARPRAKRCSCSGARRCSRATRRRRSAASGRPR